MQVCVYKHIYMYVCVCVHGYSRARVYICICMNIYMGSTIMRGRSQALCIHVYVNGSVYTCIRECTYMLLTGKCPLLRTSACRDRVVTGIYTHTHTHTHAGTYIYTHTHTHTHTHIHACMLLTGKCPLLRTSACRDIVVPGNRCCVVCCSCGI